MSKLGVTQGGTPFAAALCGRRILVTGASGYLAGALFDALANVDCHIKRVSRRTHALPPARGADVVDVLASLNDPAWWMKQLEGVDVVFHLAAQTSAAVADQDLAADHAANVAPLQALTQACNRSATAPVVVFTSTASIHHAPAGGRVDETAADEPLSAYELHKVHGESLLRWAWCRGWLKPVTVRLANVYGPGGTHATSDRGVLNTMMRRALAGQDLTLYRPGDQMRDYVFSSDVAEALLAAYAHAEALQGGRLLCGTGAGHTLEQAFVLVAERAALITGTKVKVNMVEPPPGSPPVESRSFVVENRRLTSSTGWQPRVQLKDGIDLTLRSFS